MKIEKLTDNKIRIIMDIQDIEKNTNDIHSFFNNMMNSQNLFFNILQKAEKEVNFHTDGCKLLIEAFSTFEDVVVFTITKYSSTNQNISEEFMQNHSNQTTNSILSSTRKKLIVKRKTNNYFNENCIYRFNNLDIFCEFCKSISHYQDLSIDKLAKRILLYNYNNNFYLVFKDIDVNNSYVHKVLNILPEFSEPKEYSYIFEHKLIEHAKLFIKNNAICKGIKYLI